MTAFRAGVPGFFSPLARLLGVSAQASGSFAQAFRPLAINNNLQQSKKTLSRPFSVPTLRMFNYSGFLGRLILPVVGSASPFVLG